MVDFKRIIIIGDPCSGKTTLARSLSDRFRYPHVSLDMLKEKAINDNKITWGRFKKLAFKFLQSETWVSEGNYSRIRDVVWSRADTLIWLDYSLPFLFINLIRRSFSRIIFGRERKTYYKKSPRSIQAIKREITLLFLVLNHYRVQKILKICLKETDFTHLKIIRFTSQRITNRWLARQLKLVQTSSA